MSDPTPGWYPDPTDPSAQRYWSGSAWTAHSAPAWGASSWGAPTTDPVPGATDLTVPPTWGSAGHGAYTPATSALTSSGMRRISALFGDVGRILARAWWPILAIGLVLWGGWVAVVATVTAMTVDLTALARLVALTPNPYEYPDPERTRAQVEQAEAAFTQLLRADSPGVWIGIGALVTLTTVVVSCGHIAGVSRLAIDAASGRGVSLTTAWRAAAVGGLRLLGYVLALAIIVFVLTAALVVLTVALWSEPGLAVLAVVLGSVGATVLGLWLLGRLSPIGAQVVIGPGSLRWTWHATRGRFWAVLGRYLLWAVVASVLGQVVASAVLLPLSLIAVGLMATPDSGSLVWLLAGYTITLPITMALTALTYIGVVPIWRDLTDVPDYRAISADGQLID